MLHHVILPKHHYNHCLELYDITSSAKLTSALASIKAFMHSKFPFKDAIDKGVVPSWKDKNVCQNAACSGKKGELK